MKTLQIRTQGNGTQQGARMADVVVTDDGRVIVKMKQGRNMLTIPWENMQLMVNSWLKSL